MNRVIVTERVEPPIPCCYFDWRASFEGYEGGDPQGYGPTEQAAIDDLQAQAEVEALLWAAE